ncbi:MAG: conjugative transposon protein TraM [Tannerellaceae bacterium]|jgi:conjugative transposon TraM protein|nr:conjugative transposon protein TraM [Tannerellaceae bacterium]
MSSENQGNESKPDVAEKKKEGKPKKELTPQEIQKRKKMLVYPLFFLIFAGAMWIIFAPSGDKDEKQPDGFNSELPIPKDEVIVGDKRTAYEQEAMQNKQNEKMRSLQDFAFMLGEEEEKKAQVDTENQVAVVDNYNYGNSSRNTPTIQSSAQAYQDVNKQLGAWYEEPVKKADDQEKLETEARIQELERQLAEKSEADKQLELIEKSYAIAAKYMPNAQGQVSPDGQQVQQVTSNDIRQKVVPKPVSQVHQRVVSLLAAPMDNDEFLEHYSKPRNMGFITAAGNETVTDKNSIRASVYQTVTLSNGKELQLRLQEPMRAGSLLIPAGTVLTGSAKIGGERLQITITSIQYTDNVIPVEMEVYDMDGMQGIFVPNSDEVTAMKEIAANMGTSMGSSITITDDAGSQLAADLGRSLIQGTSQFFSKKMREVKVTLKAGYKVLLLPKA